MEKGKYYFSHPQHKTEFHNVMIFQNWSFERFKETYYPGGKPISHEVTWGAEFMWDEIQREILMHSDRAHEKSLQDKKNSGMNLKTKN